MVKKGVDFAKIEKKWQKAWEGGKAFEGKEGKGKKYYVLEMFPYPSAYGLHMGHALNYTIGDIFARFKRMSGFNVLYPMGYDALGLPAENAAIKAGEHPADYTKQSIKNFVKQQKALGLSYDWSRMLSTASPDYYKWDQWIFLKMLEKGVAFRKKAPVNWCPKCKSVLANEQVHSGKCWRHGDTDVEIKHLEQWFLKITDYADELYEKIDSLDKWPERIKAMQKNWIGKSYGTEIDFEVEGKGKIILVDAVNTFVSKDGKIDNEMYKLLESYSNKKIILTNASDVQIEEFGLDKMPYEVFTLGHNPEKIDSKYFKSLLEHFHLAAEDVIYFEHNIDAVKSAESIGIKTFHYNKDKDDLDSLGRFIKENVNEKWPVFTTRPDTIYGVTFMVISAQHPRLMELVKDEQKKDIEKLLKKLKSVSEKDASDLEKEGVFTGSYAVNPINGEKIPVYAGNFVLAEYGCGMVMAVPAHDQRDFEFAKKYGIEIKQVILPFMLGAIAGCNKNIEKEFLKLGIEFLYKKGVYFIKGDSTQKENLFQVIKKNFKEDSYSDVYMAGDIFVITKNYIYNLSNDKELNNAQKEIDKKNIPKEFSDLKKLKKEWAEADLNEWIFNLNKSYTRGGFLINSDKFNGMNNCEAIEKITEYLAEKKLGKKTVNFKLRDWLVSRQRYWGTPIPIIYCDDCGIVPVSEKDLPIELPKKVEFGKGNPLERAESWIKVKCPKCGKMARRETDTMDTFVNSSWYYLRYCDSKNDKKIFDSKKANYWCPVDQYIGGAEHACMHLIYFRFYTKFLNDLGLIKFREPVVGLFNQGMLHGEDGNKMSKSLGNIIDPLEIISKQGADSLRMFLVSVASPDSNFNWDNKGVVGIFNFIKKIFDGVKNIKISKSSKILESKLNKAIKEITNYIENFKDNLAIINIRALADVFVSEGKSSRKDLESFIKLLSPFCPHIAEELWEKIGGKGFVSLAEWPVCDESKIDEELEKQEEAVDKLAEDINHVVKLIDKKVSKAYVYVLPKEIDNYSAGVEIVKKKTGLDVVVFAVNDKDKYDPEGKSKKVKPGRPGVYLE